VGKSRDSSGGGMIRLRAEQHGLHMPVEAREFSLLQNVQTPGIEMDTRVLFPDVK